VGEALETICKRVVKQLRRRGLLGDGERALEPDAEADEGLSSLVASAVSGRLPGRSGGAGRYPPSCTHLSGSTSRSVPASTALPCTPRPALERSTPSGARRSASTSLRPAVAQERITRGPDGLVRIALKRPFSDGTVAVDLDALSLLSRLAASVPPPRLHTVRYAGVLAPASKLRSRIVPEPPTPPATTDDLDASAAPTPKRGGCRYRPWAELLKRTFGVDVLECPTCKGRMKLLAVVTEPKSIERILRHLGEPTEPPKRAPARGPPFWKSSVLRRSA
jgi:hypothetical protein